MKVATSESLKWCAYKVDNSNYDYARILTVEGDKVTLMRDNVGRYCYQISNKDIVFISNFRHDSLRKSLQLNGEFHDN